MHKYRNVRIFGFIMKTIFLDAIFGRIETYEGDLVTQQIIEFGAHTRPELAFLLSFIEPSDYVYDIGAHIGTFTLPIANKVGNSGKLLAIEGNPTVFELLVRNIISTGNDWVQSYNYLIADSKYRLSHNVVETNTGAGYYLPSDSENAIEAKSLDEILEQTFTPRVVKIDIEGMEYIALKNAPILFSKRPIFYIEISQPQLQRAGSNINQLNDLLIENNYILYRNIGDRNGAHDNYIVKRISSLQEGGEFFDVLAIHIDDERRSLLP